MNLSRFHHGCLITSVVCLLLIGSLGCSDYRKGVAPVSGKCTLNGQPLTKGQVFFYPIPEEGQSAPGKFGYADVQSDGSFEVSTYEPGDGAVVARHKVVIQGTGLQANLPVHPDYTRPDRTPLEIEVPPEGLSGIELKFDPPRG